MTRYGKPLDDVKPTDLKRGDVVRPWGVIRPYEGTPDGYAIAIAEPDAKKTWRPSNPPLWHIIVIIAVFLLTLVIVSLYTPKAVITAVYIATPVAILLYLADYWWLRHLANNRRTVFVEESKIPYVIALDRLFTASELGLVDSSRVQALYHRTFNLLETPKSHAIIFDENYASDMFTELQEVLAEIPKKYVPTSQLVGNATTVKSLNAPSNSHDTLEQPVRSGGDEGHKTVGAFSIPRVTRSIAEDNEGQFLRGSARRATVGGLPTEPPRHGGLRSDESFRSSGGGSTVFHPDLEDDLADEEVLGGRRQD